MTWRWCLQGDDGWVGASRGRAAYLLTHHTSHMDVGTSSWACVCVVCGLRRVVLRFPICTSPEKTRKMESLPPEIKDEASTQTKHKPH